MYFERIYDEDLAQAAYLVGCPASSEMLVVDPLRDIDQYFERADKLDYEIVGVAETHIHADFLSGGRDLARAADATFYISGETVSGWEYGSLEGLDVERLADGDDFEIGGVRIEALHTPGHTPEHVSFAVVDAAQADEPMMVLTGDFAFVADLGRPDLLEKAAGERGTAVEGARQQFESVHDKLLALPDSTQIWPGHGAGSACGKALGSIPATTIGYERRNAWWAEHLEEGDVDGFVDELLAEQPESPTYFRHMKQMNRDGVEGGYELPALPELTPAGFRRAVDERETMVVDVRSPRAYAEEHFSGSIALPSAESASSYAGWILPYDRPLVLRVDREDLDEVARRLYRIGLAEFAGWTPRLPGDADDLSSHEILDAERTREALDSGDAPLVDVRSRSEHRDERIPGATHIHYGLLTDHLEELPRDRQLILHCASGRRASIAVGLLESHGFEHLAVFDGDAVGAWREAGFSVE